MALMTVGNSPRESVDGRFMIAQDGTPPSVIQLKTQKELREDLHWIAKRLNDEVTDSREKSLALTKLEEALMWAGKAIFKEEN